MIFFWQSSATEDEMIKRRPNGGETTKSEVVNEAVSRKRVSGTSKKLKDALVHQVIQVKPRIETHSCTL